jgi:glycogen(starch) synthase
MMRGVKVLAVGNMYPPHYLGGYELMWESGVRALRARGHEVRVLTTDFRLGDRDEADPDVRRELRWYWRDHDFPRRGPIDRLRIERHNAAVLDRHLADLDPDVVSWWAMGGMSLSLIERVRRRQLPAVGVVGDDWMVYGPLVDAWLRLWRRVPVRTFAGIPTRVDLSGAARWIFISREVRDGALRAGALERVEVSHPGVDPVRFMAREPGAWEWRLLCLGRIDSRKGVATAIEALTYLPGEATLTVDGDGDPQHGRELRELARERGLEARVRFVCSARDEVPGAYAASDALVFPVTWREPWGLVPLEAMAVGRPVVATGLGGSGEYLADGVNSLLFEAGDPAALAGAVRRLADDPGLRERLRAGGRSTASAISAEAFEAAVAVAHEAAA